MQAFEPMVLIASAWMVFMMGVYLKFDLDPQIETLGASIIERLDRLIDIQENTTKKTAE